MKLTLSTYPNGISGCKLSALDFSGIKSIHEETSTLISSPFTRFFFSSCSF